MKKTLQIKVIEHLSELLNTREAATMLLDFVKKQKADRVEFDFSDVEFMSRSFADQFHKERYMIQQSNGLMIVISNANEEIVNVLKTVERTQNKTKREFIKLPVFKYSNTDMLSDYLLSV